MSTPDLARCKGFLDYLHGIPTRSPDLVEPLASAAPRIGILVVAYNAASTLHEVLERIPPDFRARVDRVLVSDDASHDATYLVGLGYRQITDLPLTVVRQERNLGYGGNQKAGYRWAIEHDLDIVVLLHGDGQYAPEMLPEMVAPLVRDEADAVFGSRMMEPGRARRGGMPLYKYVGNKILTAFENRVMGTNLSEWHSGYRAYSVRALREIPFERNSDGFDFDTEVIIQLIEAGKRIAEVPIPTYYGDEISHVNGLRYAWDICWDVVRYRLHKIGFGSGEAAFASAAYEEKLGDASSHTTTLAMLSARYAPRSRGRLLDLGCNDGQLGSRLRSIGWEVTGVDLEELPGASQNLDQFVKADLEEGIPPEVGDGYDVVLAADVIEHLREPARLLEQLRSIIADHGVLLVSIPNFGHWYVRARVLAGSFDYDRRGILDRTHLRFFTRRSFRRMAERAGWSVIGIHATGLPLEVADRGSRSQEPTGSTGREVLARLDQLAVAVWPTLFGYQFIFELAPNPETGS